jgi:hypothetical protein
MEAGIAFSLSRRASRKSYPSRIGLRMPFDGNELIALDRFNRAVAG